MRPTSLLDDAMRRYADGDDAAFETVYFLLGPRLRLFCARLTSGGDEAQDLVQETFLKIHRSRVTYAPGAGAVPWAFAIARAEFVDRMRASRRRPELAGRDGEHVLSSLPSTTGAPDSHLAHARQLTVVARELDAMSEPSRAAYLLRHEGWTVAEAAAALRETNDVVKQRVHRASERVRAALRRYGWVPGGPAVLRSAAPRET